MSFDPQIARRCARLSCGPVAVLCLQWRTHRAQGNRERLADIFISCARPDRSKIAPLSAALEQAGWVKDEAASARDQGKLVPVSLDGTSAPLGFRQYHVIDLSAWNGEPSVPAVADLLRQAYSRGVASRGKSDSLDLKASYDQRERARALDPAFAAAHAEAANFWPNQLNVTTMASGLVGLPPSQMEVNFSERVRQAIESAATPAARAAAICLPAAEVLSAKSRLCILLRTSPCTDPCRSTAS